MFFRTEVELLCNTYKILILSIFICTVNVSRLAFHFCMNFSLDSLNMANVEDGERNAFTFTWKIKNFVRFEKISSPIFFAHSIDSGFALELVCTDHQFEGSTIGVYLELVHECGESNELDFEISCLGLNGSVLISREKLKIQIKEGKRCRFRNFMLLHDVVTRRRKEYLPQGTLTLQCKIWKSDGDMSESVLCFARSRMGIEQSSFVWPIEGFSDLMHGGKITYSVRKASQGDPILSMNFQFSTSQENRYFELQLMPPENVHKINGYEEMGNKICFYDVKLSFINVLGEEAFNQEITSLECNRISNLVGLITDELTNAENGYIVDDVLSLKCQFTFYEGIVSEEIERTVYGSGEVSNFLGPPAVVLHYDDTKKSISSLKDFHKFLYETKKFCDVKLRSETECIPAHKSILSARSRVFHTTFEDSEEDFADVSDVGVEALRQMILFIYTDTVNDLQLEDTYRLYLAAEKYKVFALKKKCSSLFIGNLTKSNVCEMLSFADQHKDENLKLAAKNFIFENEIEVIGSLAWKIFEKRNATLAEEIYSLLSKEQAY